MNWYGLVSEEELERKRQRGGRETEVILLRSPSSEARQGKGREGRAPGILEEGEGREGDL